MNIRLLSVLTLSVTLMICGCKPHKSTPPKQVAKGTPMRGAPMRAVKDKAADEVVKDTEAKQKNKSEADPKKPTQKSPEKAPDLPKPKLQPVVTPEPKTDTKAQPLNLDDEKPKVEKPDDGESNRIPRTNKAKKPKKIDPKDYKKKFKALQDLKKGDKNLPPFLGFGVLSDFEYEINWGVAKKDLPKQIPDAVLAWDGKKVRTRGYMLPLKMSEDGQVQTCFLLRDLGPCCFGGTPKMNYWVLITIPKGTKAAYKAYRSVEITGTISIGEKVEYDRVTSIYRMTATKVDWEE